MCNTIRNHRYPKIKITHLVMAKIPFTLEAWLKDKSQKVETRSGKNVRIICWDKIGVPIVALVGDADDIVTYNRDGTTGQQMQLPSDLFIITPEPEMTDFEKAVGEAIYGGCDIESVLESSPIKQGVKEIASKLLVLAREQFIKDGYIIEKKLFHDAVEKVDPDVMKEVSETIDLSNFFTEIGKKYPEVPFGRVIQIGLAAYNKSKEEALKDMPRWRKCTDCTPKPKWSNEWIFSIDSENVTRESAIVHKGYFLPLDGLEKLPGFKEDEK